MTHLTLYPLCVQQSMADPETLTHPTQTFTLHSPAAVAHKREPLLVLKDMDGAVVHLFPQVACHL